ncbi:cobyric acid synthase CobQ, partial [Methylobacterium sp. WL122]
AATRIAVPVLPRIANFDDLDPLRAEPAVEVVLVRSGEPIPGDAALVLLPGSKTTIDDLDFFRAEGWDGDLRAHLRRGGRVLGLCGGYQMLGRTLSDPDGIEGAPRTVPGLGLLEVDTVMTPLKRLEAVSGTSLPDGIPFSGYEMHVGDTTGADSSRPLLRLADG